MFFLQSRRKSEQVFEPAARNHDVLVELGQARISQSVGKLAPNLPNLLAFLLSQADFDKKWTLRRDQFLKVAHLAAHRTRLAIQFHDQMCSTTAQPCAFGALISGLQCKRVGDLQGGRQESGAKYKVQGLNCGTHRIETDCQAGTERWQRQQL